MNVEIYTKPDCNYCIIAKNLMRNCNIQFSEQVLDRNFTREILKEKFPTAKSYPVIVVDGFYIGGYSELRSLVESKTNDPTQLLTE